jgi:hypothetical protein
MRSAGDCTRPADRPRLHLLPQHRRQVEADQVVQRAARLLGVDQVAGDLARVVHGRADGLGVISVNTTRCRALSLSRPRSFRISAICQLIASPSRIRVSGQEDGVGALGCLG